MIIFIYQNEKWFPLNIYDNFHLSERKMIPTEYMYNQIAMYAMDLWKIYIRF